MLSHVLGSNPGIAGHSELHRKYLGLKDIFILRGRVFLETKERLHNKYILDKILHNPFIVSKKVFAMKDTSFIFLLREPEATLKSIFEMGKKTGIVWQIEPDLVLRYYTKRLEMMSDYAQNISGNYFYIESDELINDTDKLLGDLTSWLELETPLSQEYSVFKNTGKTGHGDPSDNIGLGRIIVTKSKKDVEVPEQMLSACQDAYESCRSVLAKNALNDPR